MDNSSTSSPIKQFYQGRTVLVTGATGFLGKSLVEKLLRSTQVRRVYLLLRSKKGKTVNQRVTELFNEALFSVLKAEVPDYGDRVQAIEGDISLPGLGLSVEVTALLQADVEVVFHGAASVSFDDTLAYAVKINVIGTFQLFRLARTFPKLKALVHISSAYANCNQGVIEERSYEPPLAGDTLIHLVDSMDESSLLALTPLLVKGYPNTYIYSKAVSEDIARVQGKGLPVIIFRPSMVVSSAKEPIKGWVDNLNGPNGVIFGVGLGLLRALHADRDCVADIVPVDLVANAVIACATSATSANSLHNHRKQADVEVYNYVSSCQNPLSWQQFYDICMTCGVNNPSVKAVWCYSMTMCKYRFTFLLCHLLLHFLPAVIVDAGLVVCGKKPMMMKVFKQVDKFSSVTAFFSTRMWLYNNEGVQRLWNTMTPSDQQQFNFDVTVLDWHQFFEDSVSGVRVHMYKDTPDTAQAAARRQFWFRMMNRLIKFMLGLLAVRLAWTVLPDFSVGMNCINMG